MQAQQLLDQAADNRQGEELDAKVLSDYLTEHVPEISGVVSIKQFPSGFSNLTYLITCGDANTDGKQWVLRRPPFGSKVKSAHDMGREFRVLNGLHQAFAYAPKPAVFCEDHSVLGCDFYLMEYIKGVIIRNTYPNELQLSNNQVRQQFFNWLDTLCELHSVDYHAIGLGELGKPAGYVQRQVDGWSKRYTAALTPDDIPTFERTIQWLYDKMPTESDKVGIIHNDYKIDNVIWSLDDPLMFKKFAAMPTTHPGAPTRAELITRFNKNLGVSVEKFDFYFCFGLFRLAGIGQQIYNRFYHGKTNDQRFARLKDKVYSLHEMCEKVMNESDL